MHILGSVTFVTLHTPHTVARGIGATECEQRFPIRGPQSFVLTAFASLLGTRRRWRHTASDAWQSLHVWCRAADRVRVLGSVTCGTLQTPDGVARGIRATESKQQFPKRTLKGVVRTAFASLLGTPCCSRHGRGAAGWRCTSAFALPIEDEFLAL